MYCALAQFLDGLGRKAMPARQTYRPNPNQQAVCAAAIEACLAALVLPARAGG